MKDERRKNPPTNVGDVIMFIEFKWSGGSENIAENPFYALVVEVNGTGHSEVHPFGECKLLTMPEETDGQDPEESNFLWAFNSHDDNWVVLSPEDWPDEVCAAVAKYRLTGEIDAPHAY